MLQKLALPFFVLFLLPSLALAESATPTIDSKCALHPATITVPAGKTASGFSVGTLENGVKCVVGGVHDNKGWGITLNGGKKYYWSQFKSNAPTEIGGPLSALVLPAGTYSVFVDGGSGARAVINYTIK